MLKKIWLFFAVICPTFAMAAEVAPVEAWKKQFANEAATHLIEGLSFQMMYLESSVFESHVDDFLDRHGWRWEMNVDIFLGAAYECFDAMLQSCLGDKNAVVKWHALLRFITSLDTDFLDSGIELKLAELFKQINRPPLIEKEIGAYLEFCGTKQQPAKQAGNFSRFYRLRQKVDPFENMRREWRGSRIQLNPSVFSNSSVLGPQIPSFFIPNSNA